MSHIPLENIAYTREAMKKAIEIFKAKKIPVYEPGEDNYERYIATANLIYRFSSPPCVVQPKCACDVRDVIKVAKPWKIPITIKNGGHSYAGGSTTNVGILMELGLMNEVALDNHDDPTSIVVKGGALWFNVYKKLVSKHLDGLVVNGGRCPTVGVSGFLLGGGLSPFTRSFGMGCDAVTEFSIVTAAGDEVTVSNTDHPSTKKGQLFWALRGAGGANFGVVVEMKLTLQKLRTPYVVAGRYTWYPKLEAMEAFMATMNSFYTQSWSKEMTIDSSWLCELGKKDSDLGVRFLVYYNGGRGTFDQEIDGWKPLTAHKELKTQLKQRSLEEKSSRFLHETLAAQWIEETRKAFPTNRTYQIYTSFVFDDTNPTKFAEITQIIRQEMKEFRGQFAGETGLLQVTFIHSGGAAKSSTPEATAFFWRGCVYHAYIMIQWDEKWLEYNMRTFLGQMKDKLKDYSMPPKETDVNVLDDPLKPEDVRATYINFPDDTLKPDVHEMSYYGKNYEKLRRVKQMWDKDNFFSWSQGIHLPGKESSRTAKTTNKNPMKNISTTEITVKEEELTDVLANQQWESYLPLSTEVYGAEALPELVY